MTTSEHFNQFSLCTWVKDSNLKFINCSETLCELAGETSPNAMKGKDDFDLIWREEAPQFWQNNIRIIKGELNYFNKTENIPIIKNGILARQQILITIIPIFNKDGKCSGIAGSTISLPSEYDIVNISKLDNKGRFWLTGNLSNEYLTKREVQVLRLILLGKTSKQIAVSLGISYRTVEQYIDKIKLKFQCNSKYEILTIALSNGVTHLLANFKGL